MECPSCHSQTNDAGAMFCPHCGADLAVAAGDLPASSVVTNERETFVEIMDEVAPLRREVSPVAAARSACAELTVMYDAAQAFVEGVYAPFQFRVTPQQSGLSALFIEIRHGDRAICRQELDEVTTIGQELTVYLDFQAPAGLQGRLPFQIYVGLTRDGVQQVYKSQRLHRVFPAREPARKVIETLKIEIKNDLHQGHASDQSLSQRIDGLDKLAQGTTSDRAADLTLIDLPPVWESLALTPCQYRAATGAMIVRSATATPPPANARCDRFTMITTAGTFHITSQPTLQFGRNRRNDIVTRLGSGESSSGGNISRYHCQLRVADHACLLVDRARDVETGEEKTSTFGVFVDGERMSNRTVELPSHGPFSFSLAGDGRSNAAFPCFDGDLFTCGRLASAGYAVAGENPSSPSALILKRRHTSEVIAIVWRRLPLALLSRDLGDGVIVRHADAFSMTRPGRSDWLFPGSSLPAGGGKLSVVPWVQWNSGGKE